jgi:hypothetical protein
MASEGMRRVSRAQTRVQRLTTDLDAARDDLRKAVRQAHEKGETVAGLARTLGVSRARIYQILED